MNKYKFKLLTSSSLGYEYFYCYGDEHFEQWLKRKNIKYEIDKKSINRFNKQKEVLDKIKEYAKEVLTWYTNEEITDEIANHILELLEEIE